VVYSPIPAAEYAPEIADEGLATEVESLKAACPAFTQRVGSCYLVEANLFGFVNVAAGESSRLGETRVLSSAMAWALRDYFARFGAPPDHIVLHLDVNGTLILGDVASQKSMTKAANSLASRVLERAQQGRIDLPCDLEAVARVKTLPDDMICEEYNPTYAAEDIVRTLHQSLASLALNRTAGVDANLTLAIRTNGVESAAAASYLQTLIKDALGQELTDDGGTIGRYIVAHEDPTRGVYLHPVLLERLHKSKRYSLQAYVDDLRSLCGKRVELSDLQQVCAGSMKKSDPKFKVYLGLCEAADEKPHDYALTPPRLLPAFASETWSLPEDVDEYTRTDAPGTPRAIAKAAQGRRDTDGPWWAGFDTTTSSPKSASSWLSGSASDLLSVVSSRLRSMFSSSSTGMSTGCPTPPKRRKSAAAATVSLVVNDH